MKINSKEASDIAMKALLSINRAMRGELTQRISAITIDVDMLNKLIYNRFYLIESDQYRDLDFDAVNTIDGEVIGDFESDFHSSFEIYYEKKIDQIQGVLVFLRDTNPFFLSDSVKEKSQDIYRSLLESLILETEKDLKKYTLILIQNALLGNFFLSLRAIVAEFDFSRKAINFNFILNNDAAYASYSVHIDNIMEQININNVKRYHMTYNIENAYDLSTHDKNNILFFNS